MTSKPIPDDDLVEQMRSAIESELKDSLQAAREWLPSGIREMISYHLGWQEAATVSGKRVRPLMTLLCCEASNGDWRQALPAAAAVEWVHNFSLLHDDIQDQSEMRRGRPTVWKIWGTAQAINTGDAIFALSRLTTLRLKVSPEKILRVHRILDQTSLALTRGQHQDISFEQAPEVTIEQYLEMIAGKTAALLGAACQLGALLSPADDQQIAHFHAFGENLGLAFQVIDDMLGVWGSSEVTGKSAIDDLRSRKRTLPVIHGLEHSKEFKKAWSAGQSGGDHIALLKKWLDEVGSREFTAMFAQRYTQDATSALEAAEPSEPAGSQLSALTARLLQRVA
jgi:geranylgeranyl diphosphate synthase type I